MKKTLFSLIFATLFITGCSGEKKVQINNDMNDEQNEMVNQVIEDTNEVHSAIAVFAEDQLLVAVQAKPWLDYKKRKIEKELKKELEKKFPNLKVAVSADYKLYWESQKLLDEEDDKKVTKQVEKLKKLAREET